jgi:outer membrane biosynthesis protein TonB
VLRDSLMCLFILAICPVGSLAQRPKDQVPFIPPRIVFAGDIAYPGGTAAGLVQLGIYLDPDGYVNSVRIVRDIPSLTPAAAVAVRKWTFSPAFLEGKAVKSLIFVNVLFNPGTVPSRAVQATPPSGRWRLEQSSYIPPQILFAWYAAYPSNAPSGTVVLDISVDKRGTTSGWVPVYVVPSLAQSVVTVIKLWKFMPGIFRGGAIETNAVAALVFHTPAIK